MDIAPVASIQLLAVGDALAESVYKSASPLGSLFNKYERVPVLGAIAKAIQANHPSRLVGINSLIDAPAAPAMLGQLSSNSDDESISVLGFVNNTYSGHSLPASDLKSEGERQNARVDHTWRFHVIKIGETALGLVEVDNPYGTDFKTIDPTAVQNFVNDTGLTLVGRTGGIWRVISPDSTQQTHQ